MKTKSARLKWGALLALVMLLVSVTAVFAGIEDPTTTWNVTPKVYAYSQDLRVCSTGTLVKDQFQSVTEGEAGGTASRTYTINNMPVTMTITWYPDNTFDFSLTGGVMNKLMVKGGNDTYLVYQYEPPVPPATNTGPVSSDTRLHDGYNANQGTFQDLSHLDLCITPVYPLTATKTAAGSYDRTVTWTLTKSVAPTSLSGEAGQKFDPVTWTVVADKTETLSNYKVTGQITVNNPNGFAVPFTVSDVLDDGTVASVTCPTSSVPANGSVICDYTALPAGKTATLNTAEVTPTDPAIKGATATAPVTFTEKLIGYDSGLLTDPRFKYEETISGDKTKTFSETFSCPADASLYVNGKYSWTETNWAYLDSNIGLSAKAELPIDCTLKALVPTKTAAGTYDRTVTWTLDKTVFPTSLSGQAGETFAPVEWKVVADKTEKLGNYKVTGNISISNPASIAQTFTVSDKVDGTAATVVCDIYTIPAGGTAKCTYEAAPSGKVETNTAVVSAAGNPDQTASAPIGWTENLIGYDSGLLTDPRFSFSETITDDKTKTFSETFSCPADASKYVNGKYSWTETNWAYLDSNIGLKAEADLPIDCTLKALVPTKTAAGTYDRTVTWTLKKTVFPTSLSGEAGQTFAPVEWKVVADKSEESNNFKVVGTITIQNPALIAQDFTVSDYLNDAGATAASVSCDMYTIPAGSKAICTYTAYPFDATATKNTAKVSAAGNADQYAYESFDFVEKLTGYDSGLLTDPRFKYEETISGDKTKTFSETFSCPADASLYVNGKYSWTETNWAYLDSNIGLKAEANLPIDCTLKALVPSKTAAGTYDRTVTWTLDKSVDDDSHSGYPGDVFTSIWKVVADKTEESSNFKVVGTITIQNPALIAQDFTVSDKLSDGTVASVDCDPMVDGAQAFGTVPAGGSLVCDYTAKPTGKTATLNTAVVTAAGNPAKEASASVTFSETLIGYDSGLLTDPRFNFSETISGDKTVTFTEKFSCPTDGSKYTNGIYKYTETNSVKLDSNIGLTDSADVTVTCEAGFMDLLKTTKGVVDPTRTWNFALYNGPDGFGTTAIGQSSTKDDADGLLLFGEPALRPDKTYTVCELGVAAGWTSFWQVNGAIVVPYDPNADDATPEDLGNRCVDFGANTNIPVEVGKTVHFTVDNNYPGGAPRTPGYWKNWNRCTGGGQAATADANGGWKEGFWLLEDVLNPSIGGGIVWDDNLPASPKDIPPFIISDCKLAVSILSTKEFGTGKQMASDPGYNLAKHLLAAQLNFGAGACVPADKIFGGMTIQDVAVQAETLLDKYNFDAVGEGISKKSADASTANLLASYLDQYNNGKGCEFAEETH